MLKLQVNLFKSQSGGGCDQRLRRATKVRAIDDHLSDDDERVIVLGDLNEGQPAEDRPAPNLVRCSGPVTRVCSGKARVSWLYADGEGGGSSFADLHRQGRPRYAACGGSTASRHGG